MSQSGTTTESKSESENSNGSEKRANEPLPTVSAFLEENHRLVQALSLFTALTALCQKIDDHWFSYVLTTLFLLTTGVLFVELRGNYPSVLKNPLRRMDIAFSDLKNRMLLFSILLDVSFAALTVYSMWNYWIIWAATLSVIPTITLLFVFWKGRIAAVVHETIRQMLSLLPVTAKFSFQVFAELFSTWVFVLLFIGLQYGLIEIFHWLEPQPSQMTKLLLDTMKGVTGIACFVILLIATGRAIQRVRSNAAFLLGSPLYVEEVDVHAN